MQAAEQFTTINSAIAIQTNASGTFSSIKAM